MKPENKPAPEIKPILLEMLQLHIQIEEAARTTEEAQTRFLKLDKQIRDHLPERTSLAIPEILEAGYVASTEDLERLEPSDPMVFFIPLAPFTQP